MILIALSIIVLLFGFVLIFGAPYLPTLKKQTETALDLLDLKPGQTLLELGSGDGRVLRRAADRGIVCIGYELNPILVIWSRLASWRHRKLITVQFGNYWHQSWPETDAIYIFLLKRYMPKLDKKIIQEITKPVKVISFAFEIPGKKVTVGKNGLFYYRYQPLKK